MTSLQKITTAAELLRKANNLLYESLNDHAAEGNKLDSRIVGVLHHAAAESSEAATRLEEYLRSMKPISRMKDGTPVQTLSRLAGLEPARSSAAE